SSTNTATPRPTSAASPFGAWRWGPEPLPEQLLRVVPQPLVFDSRAPAPHPRGIVGLHRAARRGEGSEFATIRPFQWGDRLRRIHWPRSLRTGELHVTTTYAEQDTHVVVVVDAHYDLGASGGVHGAPSSMDHSVRAAAAVAEHFAHQGDRVSLQVLSSRTPTRVPAGSGRRHARRLLETLAQVVPGPQEYVDGRLLRHHLTPGCLVVLVSAMVSPDVLAVSAALARSGMTVLVIDSLVSDVEPPTGDDAVGQLAWRLRLLEREREIRRVEAAGVPVVPWRGPGSLDLVLIRLARRPGGRG
uniref:DUF58 domain-containing protein n=1 Tax=Ornithinicoccus halotolerans TaxID=1748220 RepID=UPI001296D5A1